MRRYLADLARRTKWLRGVPLGFTVPSRVSRLTPLLRVALWARVAVRATLLVVQEPPEPKQMMAMCDHPGLAMILPTMVASPLLSVEYPKGVDDRRDGEAVGFSPAT